MSDLYDKEESSAPAAAVPVPQENGGKGGGGGGDNADAKSIKSETSSVKGEKLGSRLQSMKSNISARGGGEGGLTGGQQPLSYTSMDTNQFLKYRQRSSIMFGIPSQFFESRASIRAWGVEKLTDPAVQPVPENAILPTPFHVTIPGYYESQCEGVIQTPEERQKAKELRETRDPALGPDLSDFPPTWIPQFQPDPYFKPQPVGYRWEEQPSFKMDKFSYVNAFFQPKDPEETKMYNQMVPWCAYPYGVPAVDEYEREAGGIFGAGGFFSTKTSDNQSIAEEEKKGMFSWLSSDCCKGKNINEDLSDIKSEVGEAADKTYKKTASAANNLSKSASQNVSRLQSKLSEVFTKAKNKIPSASQSREILVGQN